jgi:hypothetical protein
MMATTAHRTILMICATIGMPINPVKNGTNRRMIATIAITIISQIQSCSIHPIEKHIGVLSPSCCVMRHGDIAVMLLRDVERQLRRHDTKRQTRNLLKQIALKANLGAVTNDRRKVGRQNKRPGKIVVSCMYRSRNWRCVQRGYNPVSCHIPEISLQSPGTCPPNFF